MLWETLAQPWRICFELAWEAYREGSLPIASVVTDADGRIVAEGRNRIHEPPGTGPVAGHLLAHAEVNALLAFDRQRHDVARCTLYTTTEPCPLCMGAMRMMSIPRFYYASRDPWAGCSAMTIQVPYVAMRVKEAIPPQDAAFEAALIALQLERHLALRTGPPAFLAVWREKMPVGVAAGEALYRSGEMQRLAAQGVAAQEALAVLQQASAQAARALRVEAR